MSQRISNTKSGRKLAKSENGQNTTQTSDQGRINPVQLAFQQDLARFVKYMTRKAEQGPRWKKPDEEAHARGSNTLFNLWNSFENRLQGDYFVQHMISTGDFLFNIKEYKIAQYHCYGRFLSSIRDPESTLELCADVDLDGFRSAYLPGGVDSPLADTVLRALLGESICSHHVTIAEDPKLQNPETVSHSIAILKILRLITQAALHKEVLCWLVFNGTVHMYTISRHLMALGYSSKVLEFLQWACMCMESAVPLMTVRYLTWRATLYTAVCQCYYDMKATTHAESFARRGLNKVNELEDIEKMSTSDATPMSARAFRQAKTKMQLMVFKRVVFETRKRPKGLLRPKTKPNLKDTIHQPWPRTPTERLLADQFHGTAAQFLTILEALSESNRRTLHCEAPPSDAEDTITDVCAELFFAGLELIAGGGGARQSHAIKHQQEIHPSVMDYGTQGLMALVQEGASGIPLQAVVKFVKHAFSYEQWETFNTLVTPTLELLKQRTDSMGLLDMKTLELMLALEPFYSSVHKPKKATVVAVDESIEGIIGQAKSGSHLDDLMRLSDVLHSCSVEPYKSVIGHMDPDMVVDAALFLWSKCKLQFHRIISSSMEGCKFVLNDVHANKWLHLITVVHTALSWSDACTFDPILFAEVALKLALVLECKASVGDQPPRAASAEPGTPRPAAQADDKKDKTAATDTTTKPGNSPRAETAASEASKYSLEGYSPGIRGVLTKSCDVLQQGYEGMVRARDAVIDTSGKSIADTAWMKSGSSVGFPMEERDSCGSVLEGVLKALHMELLFVHHRVALKLAALGSDPQSQPSTAATKGKQTDKLPGTAGSTASLNEVESNLLASCAKNPLSKALLLMHKAGQRATQGTEEQTQLLTESMELIHKAQQHDRKLAGWNRPPTDESTTSTGPPPAPLLVYRSPSIMVFKPAPYQPKGERVAWYRLFARSASGHNVKVRLNDYQLPGTGEETPATENCRLFVKDLVPNEKYIFAVAAYNSQGQLIGKTVGSSSRPVLAMHSLPTLMAWGYLAQTAYLASIPSVAKSACSVLWSHFVKEREPTEEETRIKTADSDVKIRLKMLNEDRLFASSPILVRQFLQTLFISVDFSIREGFLYCNSLSDNGPLYTGQVARLAECERLLLAIQVAGWLNDSALCLQAIVQCYGLLAPMVHQQIAAKPVIQVLLRCHAVLQEVPSLTRHRRQMAVSDSLSHMIATMTYFIAKTLHAWGEPGVCGAITELGKKMLHLDTAPDSAGTMTTMQAAAAMATANMTGGPPPKGKKKIVKKPKPAKGKGIETQVATPDVHFEELKAVEAYIMKLSQKALHRDDEELTGSEDPNLLYSYVASLPTKDAYTEVLKFKRRTRFLGFFVQVLSKAVEEGMMELALDWTHDAMTWVIRRNEMLLATKSSIIRQAPMIGLEDEKIKKFAMAIVEFGKPPQKSQKTSNGEGKEADLDEIRTRTKLETARTSKPKSLVPSTVHRKSRKYKGKTEEEIDFAIAIERMQTVLPDFWRSSQRRRKLRSVSSEELPWRVQLNTLTAGCNLELFLEKTGAVTPDMEPLYRPSLMDPDWFSFSTSGTFIMSWAGTSTRPSPDPFMGFSGSAMEAPPYASPAVTTGHTTRTQARASQGLTQAETVRTGSRFTAMTGSEKDSSAVTKTPLTYLGNVFTNLCRAIVLAHRGKYWTMLQNACRALWNATQTVLLRVSAGLLRLTDDPQGESAADIDLLRAALWKPFFTAADCLLDMMVHLQDEVKLDTEQNKKRDKVKAGDLDITDVSGLMGGVEDERGGTSLRFETPLDNTTILDTRWVKRIVMYAAEMLFYEQKWERTIDIALRFNALTRSRYAETALPMIIVAQRKLAERVNAHGGPALSQPVITVSPDTGLPEGISIKPVEYNPIEPAVHIDPEGHNVYSGSTDAMRLVSVPLDIGTSLQTLREALDTKHHTARVLEHCRQLLLCYLAGQQEGRGSSRGGGLGIRRGSSRVGFVPTQVKPPADVPPDLSDETFESLDDIRTYTLQPSQLAVVISAYDKAIEMLQFRQQRGLAAQAMHELGNIMFHSGNIRAAYKWWAEALDSILNTRDSLRNWREIVEGDGRKASEVFLQRCGVWGCLLAAVLAASIAQYIHTSNLGLRQDCCLLSACLFKALFLSSLPHPSEDKDYALYEIGDGTGQGSPELIPGVDLLSDVFRSDGRSVVASLRWVTEELARAKQLFTALPLLTLCLYFTSHVCRDLQRTVDVRILKVRVLTDLGMFAEASQVLSELLLGERLPRTGDGGHKRIIEKQKYPVFSNKKPLTDPGNLEVVNELLVRRLPPTLISLYGPQLSGQLNIAQAHLMVTMATTIYVIAADVKEELQRYQQEKEEAEVPPTPRSTVPPPQPSFMKRPLKQKSDDMMSVKSSSLTFKRKPIEATNAKPETIKGFLLTTAESILDNLCDALVDSTEEDNLEDDMFIMPPSDLELLVLAKLELSSVALQCHHAVTAASLVYSAMRALEDAAILNELELDKKSPSLFMTSPLRSANTTASPVMSHYLVSQARCRLDARLWLTCRLALARSLAEEDSGMGKLGGTARSVTSSIGSCDHHCQQGLDEAEAFGDMEMTAQFSMLEIVHSLHQGKVSEELVNKLEDVIAWLERAQCLSFSGQYLLADAVVLFSDISKGASSATQLPYLQGPVLAYRQAASILLSQLLDLGESIDLVTSSPVHPLKNVYLRQLAPLVDIKLRLGRALSRLTVDHNANVSPNWAESVRELELGLDLARCIACQRKSIEAQLLFSLGQIQRQMFNSGLINPRVVAATFVEAIKVSYESDHDLSLMRQAYLEIALTYLVNIRLTKERAPTPSTPVKTPEKRSKDGKAAKKDAKDKKAKEPKEKNKEVDKEKRAAWAAIRSAGLVAMAMHRLSLLTGVHSITALRISEASGQSLPSYALFDLLGTDDVIRVSESDAAVGKDGAVVMGTSINDSNQVQITWIHMLGYLSFLRRQCSYLSLGVSSEAEDGSKLGPIALTPLFSIKRLQKLAKLHAFMKTELQPYGTDCCGVYPGEAMSLPVMPSAPLMVISQPSQKPSAEQTDDVIKEKDVPAKEETLILGMSPSRASDLEISVQWYRPELDSPKAPAQDPDGSEGEAFVFLFSLNQKAFSLDSGSGTSFIKAGLCHVSAARAQAFHGLMMKTLEQAESELQSAVAGRQSRVELAAPQEGKPAGTPGRKRRTMGIRALSAKMKKDDNIRAKLKEHLVDIYAMMAPGRDLEIKDVPFEVSINNVTTLEAMFDPSRGCTTKTTEAFYNWLSNLLEAEKLS